jgi:hypothetical protein
LLFFARGYSRRLILKRIAGRTSGSEPVVIGSCSTTVLLTRGDVKTSVVSASKANDAAAIAARTRRSIVSSFISGAI